MSIVIEFIKVGAKAILAALAVAVGDLCTLLTGDQNLSNVTFVQWLFIASNILATWGIVYAVPNKTPAITAPAVTETPAVEPAAPVLPPLGGIHVGE